MRLGVDNMFEFFSWVLAIFSVIIAILLMIARYLTYNRELHDELRETASIIFIVIDTAVTVVNVYCLLYFLVYVLMI